MAGLTISGFDAVLKEVYEKTVVDILNSKIIARQLFQKETGSWEGRRVRYPVNLGRNQGVMATTENGTLPDAGAQVYVEHQIPIRFNHGRIQLSIQIIKHSRSNRGSFKRAMDQEMKGLVRDLSNDMNRQMFGWGTGILAYVNGAPSSATIGVNNPGGVSGSTHGNRFLNAGMNIAYINPGTGAIRAGGAQTVSSVSTDGTQITLPAQPNAAVASGDYIVRAAKATSAVVGDTAYNNEVTGLLGLVDDGTYLVTLNNISRTTYPIWKSTVVGSVGPLSADVLQRGLDVADQLGEGMVNYFLCHHSVRRSYLTLMEADRRYMGGDLSKPDIGTTVAKQKDITFGAIPFKVDKYAPYGSLFGIDTQHFTRWVEVDGEWADDDGTILLRIQDVDAYEARYRIFENYSLDRPASCVRWDGINATVVVAHIV